MSDDLIRRSDLLKEFGEEPYVWDGHDREQVQERNDWEYYTGLVKAAPAVDAVVPVYCKDCYNKEKTDRDRFIRCVQLGVVVPDIFFCRYGDRRADHATD